MLLKILPFKIANLETVLDKINKTLELLGEFGCRERLNQNTSIK